MSRIAVVLLGPPGAGKGTQARKLGGYFNYPRISTGDMLREAVKKRTALGKKAQGFMVAGDLVPDELVDALVKARLARKDCEGGFILDGYPRTIHQAEYLEGLFDGKGLKILAIGIRVGDGALLERLAGRWTCSNCGKIFNAGSSPSREGNRCDECNTVLEHREDDSARVVGERLQVYRQMTEPLVKYYQQRGCYHEVDGEESMDDIHRTLTGIVEGQKQQRQVTTG